MITAYPPNIKSIFMDSVYDYPLVNLPASLTFLQIPDRYEKSLNFLRESNIEHLELNNKNISIIDYLPKSLKKLTIIETHTELYRIMEEYPHIEIDKIPDWDYQEGILEDIRLGIY
jgi:hypothetical protein